MVLAGSATGAVGSEESPQAATSASDRKQINRVMVVSGERIGIFLL
jgi:hypothetical protein